MQINIAAQSVRINRLRTAFLLYGPIIQSNLPHYLRSSFISSFIQAVVGLLLLDQSKNVNIIVTCQTEESFPAE